MTAVREFTMVGADFGPDTLLPFLPDYEAQYRKRNAPNARLPLAARGVLYVVPRLKLPVMMGTSELAITVYRADADFYLVDELKRDAERMAFRLGVKPRAAWRATKERLAAMGFVRRGRVYYSPDCTVQHLGVVSRRVITNAGVGFLVDAFQNLVEAEAMNWHAMGTGATAEAVGDAALVTEVEARVSGTQSEPASNQYRTVGTITATAGRSITEHGVFSASTAGVLWDRSVFTAVALNTNDSSQFTYTGTFTAGGT